MVSEKKKFNFFLKTIRKKFKVTLYVKEFTGETIKRRISNEFFYDEIRKPIDGYCYLHTQKIYIQITPIMSEDDWSEATSVLLHEYGHCITTEESERKAWKNAEKWVDKNYAELKPRRFEEIKKIDLGFYLGFQKQNKFLMKHMPDYAYDL